MSISNFITLDDPSSNGPQVTQAVGINNFGQIVGFYKYSVIGGNLQFVTRDSGFIYSAGTWTDIRDPSTVTNTDAFGIKKP